MKWAGDTKCSSRARQLTPGRQPVAAAQHRAAVRAAAVLLVLLQQHRARSAVDRAVNWRTTILLFFISYNSHNNCHWIVNLTFSISSSLTSAPAHQRVVGCVHNGVNLEPGDVSLVQRHLWWRDCKRGHHNRPRCVLLFQTNWVPRWYCSLPKALLWLHHFLYLRLIPVEVVTMFWHPPALQNQSRNIPKNNTDSFYQRTL